MTTGLADQLESSGMMTGFGKLSTKKHLKNVFVVNTWKVLA